MVELAFVNAKLQLDTGKPCITFAGELMLRRFCSIGLWMFLKARIRDVYRAVQSAGHADL
ncbi:hypothetical protein PQR75_39210 [Paraburkholderia fungorum]|uniref:hypothetical protein n=1 Tax=Paraburkholderia fungorum TaxID=134537 RepID=UPI0038BBE93E